MNPRRAARPDSCMMPTGPLNCLMDALPLNSCPRKPKMAVEFFLHSVAAVLSACPKESFSVWKSCATSTPMR